MRTMQIEDPAQRDLGLTTLSYGRRRLMSYDALGRLIIEVLLNSGGTPILTMVDTYDSAGRKTKQVKNSTTTTFTYDNADRPLSQVRPGGKSVTYTLDTVSNLKTIKAEGTQPVTMALNNVGCIITIQDGPTRVTPTYEANRRSREAGWEHALRK